MDFAEHVRDTYRLNLLVDDELIRDIEGKIFGSLDELTKKVFDMDTRVGPRGLLLLQKVEPQIYVADNKTPFYIGLSDEKRNLMTLILKGKGDFKGRNDVVGYICYHTDHIIGGKPKVGKVLNDNGNEYFNLRCMDCNETLNRIYINDLRS